MSIHEESCGRSSDHPAEIAKRGGHLSAGRVSFNGFWNDQHAAPGPVKLIKGCPEKFAADLKKFEARQARRGVVNPKRYSGTDPRFYIMPV